MSLSRNIELRIKIKEQKQNLAMIWNYYELNTYSNNFVESICRKVWDALTGDVLHSFEHKHIVRACAFSDVSSPPNFYFIATSFFNFFLIQCGFLRGEWEEEISLRTMFTSFKLLLLVNKKIHV